MNKENLEKFFEQDEDMDKLKTQMQVVAEKYFTTASCGEFDYTEFKKNIEEQVEKIFKEQQRENSLSFEQMIDFYSELINITKEEAKQIIIKQTDKTEEELQDYYFMWGDFDIITGDYNTELDTTINYSKDWFKNNEQYIIF